MKRQLMIAVAAASFVAGGAHAQMQPGMQPGLQQGEQSRQISQNRAAQQSPDAARNALFEAMDDDGDGALSRNEYVDFVAAAANVTRADADRQFDEIARGGEAITLAELASAELPSPYGVVAGEVVSRRALFSAMDRNSDGYVTSSEYASFMNRNLEISRPQARARFREISGEDDRLSISELLRMDQVASLSASGRRMSGSAEAMPMNRRSAMMMDGQARQGMTQMFREMDRDSDNRITRSEYVAWRRQQAGEVFDRIAGPSGSLTLDDMTALRQEWMRSAQLRGQ